MDLDQVPARCPICSLVLQACGGHPSVLVTPGVTFTRGDIMTSQLPATKEYDVEVNGTKTTLRLNELDARARGLVGSDEATTDLAAAGSAPVGSAPAVRDPYASLGGKDALTPEQIDAADAERVAADAERLAAEAKAVSTTANKARRAADKSA